MRKTLCILAAFLMTLSLINVSHAALVGLNGTTTTELYSSSGTYTTIGGLDLYGGQLYFGQFKEIRSLDTASLTSNVVGTVPSNAGNSIVVAQPNSGTLYTAYGTSYSAPYPYTIGSLDNTGTFTQQAAIDGIYDAAVDSNGNLYLTANPGNQGTQVLRYNWTDGSTETVIEIGGASAGLAFDANDNLYVADNGNGQILSFSATNVAEATTPLTSADATGSIDLASPNYLAIDSENGYLYASYLDTSWNAHVDQISLVNPGEQITITDGGGKMVLNDDGNLYMLDTDWGTYSSTINLVTIPTSVPEPSTILLLLAGATSLTILRRR